MTAEAHEAVVIGAARGIGEAVAARLAADPACERLILADVDADRLAATAGRLGRPALAIEPRVADVTDAAQLDALVAGSAHATRLAIVAGAFLAGPSLSVERGAFERLLAVNLIGVYFAAQAYAREMVRRDGGAIVAVASIAARMPRMRQAAYCASKAGMRQAVRVLGMEVAARASASTSSPGAHRHADDARARPRSRERRRPRVGKPGGAAPADPGRPRRPPGRGRRRRRLAALAGGRARHAARPGGRRRRAAGHVTGAGERVELRAARLVEPAAPNVRSGTACATPHTSDTIRGQSSPRAPMLAALRGERPLDVR